MEGNLLDFNWETDGEDFFGIETPESKPTPKATETEDLEDEVEETPGTTKKEVETEEEEQEDFFEEGSEEEEEEQGSTDLGDYNNLYGTMKENGLFEFAEIEENEEITDERFLELQQEEIEAQVNNRLKVWAKEELDDDAQAFIKFKMNGGNTQDFFKTYSSDNSLPTGDIKEEDYQDKVIRYQLKQEGWDSDEIEDRLEYLTQNNKKEAVAKKYDKRIKEVQNKNKEATIKQAEAQREAALENERVFKESVKTVLEDTEEVNGLKITPKDRTELYNFLTKKNHKVSDTRSITGFQKKLGEAFQDTNKMILLAKIINSDFDMSHFEKAGATKKTRQVKSNLEQRKNLRPGKSGSSSQGSSLADIFN